MGHGWMGRRGCGRGHGRWMIYQRWKEKLLLLLFSCRARKSSECSPRLLYIVSFSQSPPLSSSFPSPRHDFAIGLQSFDIAHASTLIRSSSPKLCYQPILSSRRLSRHRPARPLIAQKPYQAPLGACIPPASPLLPPLPPTWPSSRRRTRSPSSARPTRGRVPPRLRG